LFARTRHQNENAALARRLISKNYDFFAERITLATLLQNSSKNLSGFSPNGAAGSLTGSTTRGGEREHDGRKPCLSFASKA
jgi:hypothetical protein